MFIPYMEISSKRNQPAMDMQWNTSTTTTELGNDCLCTMRYILYDKVKPSKGTLKEKYLGQLLLPMMINYGQQQYASLFGMQHLIFRRRSDGYHRGVSPSRCPKAKVGGHKQRRPVFFIARRNENKSACMGYYGNRRLATSVQVPV